MIVYVKHAGKSYDMEIDPSEQVEKVKVQMEQLTGVPKGESLQRIMLTVRQNEGHD